MHGDFRPGNTIVGPDARVRAVLDWELCTLGDPLCDLGWLVAYWGGLAGHRDDLPLPIPTRAEGFGRADQLVTGYTELTGRSVGAIGYYVAFAQWKLACMLTGVHARSERGAYGGTAVGFDDLADKVERLVRSANDYLAPAAA